MFEEFSREVKRAFKRELQQFQDEVVTCYEKTLRIARGSMKERNSRRLEDLELQPKSKTSRKSMYDERGDKEERSPCIKCYKCQKVGHIAYQCPLKRTKTEKDDGDSSTKESVKGALLLNQHSDVTSHKAEDSEEQREQIFQTRCYVEDKVCSMVINSGSCTNIASSLMVEKLQLPTLKHPNPYTLQWLNECGAVKVTKQVRVAFSVGRYQDEVLCDVAPMQTGHILLGRPWQHDRKVTHDGYRNVYMFEMNNRTIKLIPLSSSEASQDRAKIAEAFKLRGKKDSALETEKSDQNYEGVQKSGKGSEEKKNPECVDKNREEIKQVSAIAIKREVKSAYFPTNTVHSSMHRVNDSLLQVKAKCFPKKIPKEKSKKSFDSRTNHLKEGGNDTNRARSKPRKWKSKASNQDYNKLQGKDSSSRLSNLHSKGISRLRKHGIGDNKFRSDLGVSLHEGDINRIKVVAKDIGWGEGRMRATSLYGLRRRLISGIDPA